jgi:hypothetical protein
VVRGLICTSHKVRFASKEQAEAAAQESANRDRIKLRVYQCRACHGWHRTSKFGGTRKWIRPASQKGTGGTHGQ